MCTKTRPSALLAASFVTVALAAPAAAAAIDPTCGSGPVEAARLDLFWVEVPDPGTVTPLAGDFATLVATNRADEPLIAEIEVVTDAGTPDMRRRRLAPFRLAAGERRSTRVKIEAPAPGEPMRFSGLMVAAVQSRGEARGKGRPAPPSGADPYDDHARRPGGEDVVHPRPAGAGARHGSGEPAASGHGTRRRGRPGPDVPDDGALLERSLLDTVRAQYAPDLYFHRRDDGKLLAYGERALRERFGAGDLRAYGNGGKLAPDDDAVTLRVAAGGPGRVEPLAAEAFIPTLDAEHGDGTAGPTLPPFLTTDQPRICVKWQIGVTDKGLLVQAGGPGGAWISEDYWSLATGEGLDDILGNPSPNLWVTARGVRVKLSEPGWEQTFDANHATGCFLIPSQRAGRDLTMRVYAFSTDKDGNRIRIVDPQENTFSFVEQIEAPAVAEQRTYYVGDFSARATMAAVSAFSSYRFHYGVTGKEMRIRESGTCGSAGGNNSSAHFDASLLADGVARVRIHDGTGTTAGGAACSGSDHRRWKFLIGHEMGHAWLLLAIGRNAFEPDAASGLTDSCETVCGTGSGYSIGSLEWNALGAREGAAHFYATEVWNDHQSPTAVFTWFGAANDVEFNNPAESGGRIDNNCTTNKRCGKATILDWLRFYWDWHTPWQAGDKPSGARIRDVYRRAVDDHWDEGLTLTRDNYYFRFRQAMQEVVQSAAQMEGWDSAAAWNGIDTNQASTCPEPYPYPDCACWTDRCAPLPDFCRGEVGCPCADVDLGACPVTTVAADGCYPDGPGSYLGSPGFPSSNNPLGQYCSDAGGGDGAVCTLVEHDDKGVSVCRQCPGDHGCPCFDDGDCDATAVSFSGHTIDLACWGASGQGWLSGPGTCLPAVLDEGAGLQSPTRIQERAEFERTAWLCKGSCPSLEDATNVGFECWYNQMDDREFDYAACVESGGCEDPETGQAMVEGECEIGGRRCDPDTNLCRAECDPLDNTTDGNPDCQVWGYPSTWACTTWTEPARCVPSLCRDNPITEGLDWSECQQFVLGND